MGFFSLRIHDFFNSEKKIALYYHDLKFCFFTIVSTFSEMLINMQNFLNIYIMFNLPFIFCIFFFPLCILGDFLRSIFKCFNSLVSCSIVFYTSIVFIFLFFFKCNSTVLNLILFIFSFSCCCCTLLSCSVSF